MFKVRREYRSQSKYEQASFKINVKLKQPKQNIKKKIISYIKDISSGCDEIALVVTRECSAHLKKS